MDDGAVWQVQIAGFGDKRHGTLTVDFLPPQLIYTGKTPACHPRNVAFPPDCHITHSPNHWSNEKTVNDYIVKIIVSYINKIRERIGCSSTQKTLVLFDVLEGKHASQHWTCYNATTSM